MTLIKKDDIKKMSIPELKKSIAAENKTAKVLGTQLRTLQSQDHKTYKQARTNIARLNTELTAKQRQEANKEQ